MHVVQRALSTVAVGAMLVPVLGAGPAAAQEAAAPRPAEPVRVAADGILDPVLDPVLELLEQILAPLTNGLSQVGDVLQVPTPAIPVPGVSPNIEWLCDGQVIPGSQGQWTFLPAEAQAGCTMAARVFVTYLGQTLEVITNAIQIPAAETPQTPAASRAPVVSGDPKVGKQLTVSAPTWEGDGVVTTYQWLRAGTPISGATGQTYTVAPDDVGKALSVRATGTREGAPAPGTTTSNSVVAVLGDAPTATTPVRITGVAEVGGTLSAAAPVWSGTGPISTGYQWLRDGEPIAGATGATYAVVAADVDRSLSVRATGTRPGYQPGTSTSAPVTVAPGAPLTPASPPRITGTPKAGEHLTVLSGTWSPDVAGTEFGFQWLRDGEAIPGATTDGYIVRAADAGRTLAVVVTASATGHASGTATTEAVEVARLDSTTALALVKKRLLQGKRAKVRVTVRATGASPTGTVTVREGARVVARLTLRADGTASGVLKKLKPGRHRLTAHYAGTGTVAGSASKPVTLTIVKKKRR